MSAIVGSMQMYPGNNVYNVLINDGETAKGSHQAEIPTSITTVRSSSLQSVANLPLALNDPRPHMRRLQFQKENTFEDPSKMWCVVIYR